MDRHGALTEGRGIRRTTLQSDDANGDPPGSSVFISHSTFDSMTGRPNKMTGCSYAMRPDPYLNTEQFIFLNYLQFETLFIML